MNNEDMGTEAGVKKYLETRASLRTTRPDGMGSAEWMGRMLARGMEEDGHAVMFEMGPTRETINALGGYINEMMRERGFWNDDPSSLTSIAVSGEMRDQLLTAYDSMKVMLVVTELAEGVEGLRKGNGPSDHIPDFNCMEEEYADAVIRIMDHCAQRGWRLGEAIAAKMAYNATRAHKHGKKF